MFTVCAVVESDDILEFRDELADWLESSDAPAHRVYPEGDGSISIFLDYPTEYEAREAAAALTQTWPFEWASPADDGRYVFVFQRAASSGRSQDQTMPLR
jgi:hypothetical protein